ncbi:MAG TPA: SMC family ATPase [Pyrinomonadaceae bacterium]|nr:SMC family ATPase [Pyrinomonadaceae bacterium]
MHISKIELENIKSHASATFEFPRGTTAITGENGAGKTSIIEAAAWVLFDLLEYKKDDFLRRGATKGSVAVTFISGLDEREYTVYRDTGTSYHVNDPRLGARIADKKDEVFRFLWQHLGLEPGTDLRSLFRQAIGVPQGTFTAIFLEGATDRKIAFDRLLKVEEYRQAAEKLRETARYLDNSVADVRERIARSEGELSRSEIVTKELDTYRKQTAELTATLTTLSADLESRRALLAGLDEAEKTANALTAAAAERKRLDEALSRVEAAKTEIADLRPKIAEQEKLESCRDALHAKLAEQRAVAGQLTRLDEQLARLRVSYKANAQELKEAREKAVRAADVSNLEQRDAQLIREIASLRASLERDQRFQKEIKNGLCPILSQACLNLKPGETLESFVTSQFAELNSQIAISESRHSTITTDLMAARDAIRFASIVDSLLRREEELKAEGTRLSDERLELEKNNAGLAELEREFATLDARLREHSDPRSRVKYLDNEVAREPELRGLSAAVTAELDKLEQQRIALVSEPYDRTRHLSLRVEVSNAERKHAEAATRLDLSRQREQQLAVEIEGFTVLRGSLAGEFQEKEKLETVAETTKFIRDTLKEAAPRVARNYVYHVSLEASQLFREITGGAERTLKWGEDYAISIEEDGYERPFQSLSGGEQMAAALAVRLAILKQLSDIRIAFFDEPTTNMDAERRENFALEISRIKHFDQLFVISHDETFDNYVDNVLHIERSSSRPA